uniref:Uncharacterized protein n=1 Tax=Hyaloperonospora arabidopsidis (strain Emoy2) TaxID=559515 RepID=M4BMC5_HYAAE
MRDVEFAEQVRSFVKLANVTQTSQLHEWNLKSLQRALQWARVAEDAGADTDVMHGNIDRRIREWFPVATLPTLPLNGALTADALRHGRVHLLQSILQSPFLATHPTRSELLFAVLKEVQKRREDATANLSMEELEEHSATSSSNERQLQVHSGTSAATQELRSFATHTPIESHGEDVAAKCRRCPCSSKA